jgi:hypothetical protein
MLGECGVWPPLLRTDGPQVQRVWPTSPESTLTAARHTPDELMRDEGHGYMDGFTR